MSNLGNSAIRKKAYKITILYAFWLVVKMLVRLVVNFNDKTTIITEISVVVILACMIGFEFGFAVFAITVVEFLFFFAPCIEKCKRKSCDENNQNPYSKFHHKNLRQIIVEKFIGKYYK